MPPTAIPEDSTPKWASRIDREVKDRGFQQIQVAERSRQTVKEFRNLDPALERHHVTPATLSRMCSGKDLQKPRWEKVVVLHLTLQCMKRGPWTPGDQEEAYAAAVRFAEEVAAAVACGSGQDSRGDKRYDRFDPRQHRTFDLFGEHGLELLEQTQTADAGEAPWIKLATLHYLTGNVDDARYWCTHAPASATDRADPAAEVDVAAVASLAYEYGRQYLGAGRPGVAIVYLELAAESGHADSAYQLGDLHGMRENSSEAIRWFLKAGELGHLDGSRRANQLSKPNRIDLAS